MLGTSRMKLFAPNVALGSSWNSFIQFSRLPPKRGLVIKCIQNVLVYQRFELFVRGTNARSDMLPSALSVSGPSQSADPGTSAFRLQSAAYVAGGIYQSWKSRKHYDLVLGFARSSHFFCFSSCDLGSAGP